MRWLNPHLRLDKGADINPRIMAKNWPIYGERIGRNWQLDPDLTSARSTDRRHVTVTLPKLRYMDQ